MAEAALELGLCEQRRDFPIAPGGDHRQPVERTSDQSGLDDLVATASIPAGDAQRRLVEGVREAYAERLAMQQEGLAGICAAAQWGFSVHRTDHPPEAALLALYTALSPEPGHR